MKYNNIYKIDTENKRTKSEKNKILIILISILTIILLLIILIYSIDTIKRYDVYKDYEAQLISLNEEEQKKQEQIAIEQENLRQAKIPKLTEEGIQNVEKYIIQKPKEYFNI